MVLAAGLDGIAERLDPGAPHRDNMYLKTSEELRALGVDVLPRSLEEAIDAFEADSLSKMVFGEQMYRAWIEYKREEWQSYTSHVSEWEFDRYLKFF